MSVSLQADCTNCFGLCCVVPAFSASADFAINKDAGKPCPNLRPDFRCGIHTRLRQQGFPGCAVYDCFGAGQKISQVTFGGHDWLRSPRTATRMFEAFPIMRQLHELLWYLAEALTLNKAGPLHSELRLAFDETERLSNGSPESLLHLDDLDMAAHRRDASSLLLRVSELVRAEARPKSRDQKRDSRKGNDPGPGREGEDHVGAGPKGAGSKSADLKGAHLNGAHLNGAHLNGAHLNGAQLNGSQLNGADLIGADLTGQDLRGANLRGADLIGADLTGKNLRGANLRGAYLIGADLRGADLRVADLIGADLRGADLRGADLTESIFLIQSQLNAAKGDKDTKLPTPLTRPTHWSAKSL